MCCIQKGDGSWHGGCLALAELARRGVLLPVSFPQVVPVISQALHYDVRRGPHSIGSHVRDAAAYVCWAFGRAYSNKDMKGVLEQLAPHLLRVACYDREVIIFTSLSLVTSYLDLANIFFLIKVRSSLSDFY